MTEIVKTVLTQEGFSSMMLVLVVGGLGLGFYKGGTIMISLLDKTLTKFLEEFNNMVKSIKDLGIKEMETQALHTAEHNKIIGLLEQLLKNSK